MWSISPRATCREGVTRADEGAKDRPEGAADRPVPGRSKSIEVALGVRLSALPGVLCPPLAEEEHAEESLRGWAHGWWCATRIVAS
jgi:hypothetical protein